MVNHIGTNNIETERLFLRRFILEDADQMFNNWAGDPENTKYLRWKAHENIEETKQILNMWQEEYKDTKTYNWCITLKDTNEVIGSIGLGKLIEDIDCCEIGYVISKKYWNQGITTEALKSILNYLFNKVGFNRIQAMHNLNNPASGRVMKKSGLTYEGILRDWDKDNNGNFCDVAIYSILKSEFKEGF